VNRQDRIAFVGPPHRCLLPAGAMPGRVSTELPEHPEATAHEERDDAATLSRALLDPPAWVLHGEGGHRGAAGGGGGSGGAQTGRDVTVDETTQ